MQANKNSSTTWILVAHRAGAQLFSVLPRDRGLQTEKVWQHPEGRLRSSELQEDQPGMTFESAGAGQRRKEPPLSPTEHVAETFANEIGQYLDRARHEARFDRLVLVAGPQLLGRLRGQLSEATAATVVGSVDKNLHDATADEVRQHVRAYID